MSLFESRNKASENKKATINNTINKEDSSDESNFTGD
jgi:hypothetical protein